MKTNELARSTLVDDGECISFHSFSSSLDTSCFTYDGFELLVLPAGSTDFRVAGETFVFDGPQVILLGPGLEHGWKNGGGEGLAIRWPADLLGPGFLDKRQTQAIAGLLEDAAYGVRIDPVALSMVRERLEVLRGRAGFAIYLDLLGLLHELSNFDKEPLLRVLPPAVAGAAGASRAAGACGAAAAEKKSGIEEVMALMQANYFRPMTLEEMARKACMTKGSFCRSFRKRTGKTYSESLNEIRLGHICRLLSETTDTVSEIAYRSGYQNIYYFHRHFKRQKGCTPLEFRAGRR